MNQEEKLRKCVSSLSDAIEVIIQNLHGLKASSVYEKFEVPIQLIINNTQNSITELNHHILDSIEGLLDLVENFLNRGKKND